MFFTCHLTEILKTSMVPTANWYQYLNMVNFRFALVGRGTLI